MDLLIQMRVMYYVKHCYAIRFKFGDQSLTSLTQIVHKAKASIYFIIKKIYFHIFVSLSVYVYVSYVSLRKFYVKHCYAIRFKFGDQSLTSLTQIVHKAKASIYFIIKKIYFHIFVSLSAFITICFRCNRVCITKKQHL